MLSASAQYRAALPYPARRVTRLEVYRDGVRVGDSLNPADNLDIEEGTVTASLTSRVTRTARLQVHSSLFPAQPTDLLSPTAAVLKISTGIGYPNGSYEIFPVFTGRVQDAEQDASGAVTLSCEDFAADVIGFAFERPEPSQEGGLITSEIRRLILEAKPDAVFGTNDVPAAAAPQLVWDEDRGRALDDLAKAVRGRWYALGDGSFVVRKYPYTTGAPVLSLVDNSGGVVLRASRRISRDNTANSVTVVSERMDGTDPVRVTARDVMPSSPTFFGGTYGRVSKIVKVQTPLTNAQAQDLAIAQLSASTALLEQWSIDCVPDATLEPGDTIQVSYRGASSLQVIDAISYPLLTGGPMTLQTRSSVAVPVTS